MSALAIAASDRSAYQLEGLVAEFDASGLLLRRDGREFPLADAVTGGTLERTIEGASTLTLNVRDRDRLLWRSGMLGPRAMIGIDGLRFILVHVGKQQHDLTLTFEDYAVWLLRSYPRPGEPFHGFRVANATQTKRVEFARRLVEDDVKELAIPFYAEGLLAAKPITSASARPPDSQSKTERAPGFPPNVQARLTVKDAPMTSEQAENAAVTLDVGRSLKVSRAELVISMMVAIQESALRNLTIEEGPKSRASLPDRERPRGVFQQIPAFGWPGSRDVATDAHAFFAGTSKGNHGLHEIWTGSSTHPTTSEAYGTAGDLVQGSGDPDAYAQWRDQAEEIVTAYGVAGGDTADASQTMAANWSGSQLDDPTDTSNMFVRGAIVTKGSRKFFVREDNWTCLGRLADEVHYRRFVVSGAVYFVGEPYLFASAPRMQIGETDDGVDWVNGDYDTGKRNATVTVDFRTRLWQAPPGSTVELVNEGPFSGRWLVVSISRPLFSSAASISLKKPRPVLPEQDAPEHPQQDKTPTFRVRKPTTGKPKRTQPDPKLPDGSSIRVLAKQLLGYMDKGFYRDDHPPDERRQWQKLADGETLTNQCGTSGIVVDVRLAAALVMLLDSGYSIGTFALCEDHPCNSGQHPPGQAVDISSLGRQVDRTLYPLNGSAGAAFSLQQLVIEVMDVLAPYAWDLICNGIGTPMPTIQAHQLDNRQPRGGVWVDDHLNHMHFGIAPGKRDTDP